MQDRFSMIALCKARMFCQNTFSSHKHNGSVGMGYDMSVAVYQIDKLLFLSLVGLKVCPYFSETDLCSQDSLETAAGRIGNRD